jgi:adenylate kinase family enzyme
MDGYNRILVIGSPGSGKSNFSLKIHKITGIPLIHLDDEYWLKDWMRPDKQSWEKRLDEILQGKKWIIDGNYLGNFHRRLEHCDLVILLDVPIYICLWRVMMRGLARLFGKKETLPKKVREGKSANGFNISANFIILILSYRLLVKHKMLKLIKKFNKELIIFNH